MKLGSKKSIPVRVTELSLLQNLPIEMHLEILSYLPQEDILSFAAALVGGNAGAAASELKWQHAIMLLRKAAGLALNTIPPSDCHVQNFIQELKIAIARITQEHRFLKEKSVEILENIEGQEDRDSFTDCMQQIEVCLQQKFNNITHLKKLGTLIDLANTIIANSQLKVFHTLFLKLSNITRITPEFVAQHQAQLDSISAFSLENNFLATLPHELTQNSKAVILNLACNQIRSISDSILEMKELKTLNLANNFICYLPNRLRSLHTLRKLFLQHNELRDFPAVLLTMPELTKIGLTHNRIPQADLEQKQIAEVAWQRGSNTQLLIQQFEALSFSKKSETKKIQSSLKSLEKLDRKKR